MLFVLKADLITVWTWDQTTWRSDFTARMFWWQAQAKVGQLGWTCALQCECQCLILGIGRALAKKLVACGAHVIALSRTKKHLDSLVAEEPSIQAICVNLSDWNATRTALQNLDVPVHGLINNAAIAILEPFLEASEEHFDEWVITKEKSGLNIF